MAESTTEIDLDSVIDRLLEGTSQPSLPVQRIPARITPPAACVYYLVRVNILTYHFLCLQFAEIVQGSRYSCKSMKSSTYVRAPGKFS
jgi:hypothetical protein